MGGNRAVRNHSMGGTGNRVASSDQKIGLMRPQREASREGGTKQEGASQGGRGPGWAKGQATGMAVIGFEP